jgi:hypothetical protein
MNTQLQTILDTIADVMAHETDVDTIRTFSKAVSQVARHRVLDMQSNLLSHIEKGVIYSAQDPESGEVTIGKCIKINKRTVTLELADNTRARVHPALLVAIDEDEDNVNVEDEADEAEVSSTETEVETEAEIVL